jgi:hypothetical protein
MRLPRQIVVAVATVGVVTTLGHAVLPSSNDQSTPVKAEQHAEQQYGGARRRELEEQRLRANREGDAISRDALRPAEHRATDLDAAKVIRSLLRKP